MYKFNIDIMGEVNKAFKGAENKYIEEQLEIQEIKKEIKIMVKLDLDMRGVDRCGFCCGFGEKK